MRSITLAFFSACFLFSNASLCLADEFAAPPIDHSCGVTDIETYHFNWCIDAIKGTTNPDILYTFHGASDSEQSWFNGVHGRKITKAIRKLPGRPPIFISISLSQFWLVTDDVDRVIVEKLMPALELAAHRNKKPGIGLGRRLIWGLSMGGFNASRLVFKHPALFDRAVFVCPIILGVGPFADRKVLNAILEQHPYIDRSFFFGVIDWLERTFPSPDDWAKANIISLIDAPPANLPPIYLSTGRKDQFGFFPGAEEFAMKAHRLPASANVHVTWRPMDGGHCVYDPDDIARFLHAKSPKAVTD